MTVKFPSETDDIFCQIPVWSCQMIFSHTYLFFSETDNILVSFRQIPVRKRQIFVSQDYLFFWDRQYSYHYDFPLDPSLDKPAFRFIIITITYPFNARVVGTTLSALSSSPFHYALQDGFGQTWWTGDMTNVLDLMCTGDIFLSTGAGSGDEGVR